MTPLFHSAKCGIEPGGTGCRGRPGRAAERAGDDDDERLLVFPPKADDKCYTCALNYAMTWLQNPSEELHYTNADTQCLYIVHGCYPRLSACTYRELVEVARPLQPRYSLWK